MKFPLPSLLHFNTLIGFITGSVITVAILIISTNHDYLMDSSLPTIQTCKSWLAPARPVDDSWHLMKVYPKASTCTLRGFSIEELDPLLNFRRPYYLGYDPNVESPLHLLPFFRGYQDASLGRRPRRVYLDLGGNMFNTSVQWFLRYYPLDFTEIHVFEAVASLFTVPDHHLLSDELRSDPSAVRRSEGAPEIPNWALDRIKSYNSMVSNTDSQGAVNITRFIKEELKITANDALIVKMDIESSEWDVLADWLKDPEMSLLVDELFVEVHYNHPSMSYFSWNVFSHSREEAAQLFEDLRNKGFFVHSWP